MPKVTNTFTALAIAIATLAMPLGGASAQGVGLSNASVQAPASASNTYFADAEQIAAYLRQRGQAAEVSTDSQGDPQIATGTQGARYNIYFYGCTNGQKCNSITFEAGFRLKNNASLEELNAWNIRKRYAYAVQRADQSFALRMDIAMVGGLSEDNFVESVRLWGGQLGDFLRHIKF
ncbi:MAG: YbjN domain-containing protein [Hyphomicrobiaceae bacterium]